jgi:tetratricopeptide (TPR) repeat protein
MTIRNLTFAILLAGLCGCSSVPKWASTSPAPVAQTPSDAALSKPAKADLYLGIVSGLINQGRYEAAIAFLDQYKVSELQTPRYQMLRGDALLGAKRYEDATATYDVVLKSEFAAQAYNGLGRVEGEQKHWDIATSDFSRASTLDPANADYLNNLGYAELQQRADAALLPSAEMALERAHELSPGSQAIRNNLILAASLAGDRQKLDALTQEIADQDQRMRVSGFAAKWVTSRNDGAATAPGGLQ